MKKPDLLSQWIIARDYYGHSGAAIGLLSGLGANLLLFFYPHLQLTYLQIGAGSLGVLTYSYWGWFFLKGSSLSINSVVKQGRAIALTLGASWTLFLSSLAYQAHKQESAFLDLTLIYALVLMTTFPSTFRADRLVTRSLVSLMLLTLLYIGQLKFSSADLYIFVIGNIIYFGYTLFTSEVRQQQDDDHQRQQRRLEQIFDAFPGGVSLIKDLKYQLINKYLKQQIPTGESMMDRPLGYHGAENPWVSQVKEFAQGTNKQIIFEAPIQTHQGLRTHLTSATRIARDEIVMLSVDIQDLVDARQEAENQKARNVANAKLVSLGEMGAGIAHEINNPLAVLKGRLALIEKCLNDENLNREKIKNHIEKLLPMANRIEKIVRSMRNLSRTGNLETELSPTLLRQIIDESLVFMEARLKNYGAEITLSGNALDCKIMAVESQIVQVIVNAIANSHDAIQEAPEKWVKITAQEQGDFIEIKIQDSGPGIKNNDRDKIGQPFFTTKAPGKGTGLGLSISKTIIEKHDGKLYFDHQQPHTTLVILIPKAKPDITSKAA